jgi:hypothetical protein
VLVSVKCVFVLMNAFKKHKNTLKGIFVILGKTRVLFVNCE